MGASDFSKAMISRGPPATGPTGNWPPVLELCRRPLSASPEGPPTQPLPFGSANSAGRAGSGEKLLWLLAAVSQGWVVLSTIGVDKIVTALTSV